MLISAVALKVMEIKTLLPVLITCPMSYVLWYLMFKRRRMLMNCVRKLNDFSSTKLSMVFSRSRLFNAVAITCFTIQITYAIMIVYLLHQVQEPVNDVWNFSYKMRYDFWHNCVRFLLVCAYNFQVLTFPGLVTFLIGGMYLNCRDSLISYEKKLGVLSRSESFLSYVMEYSNLVDIINDFNDVLSAPAFAAIVLNFLLMFNSVATFLLFKNKELLPSFIVENAVSFLFSSCSVLWMTVTASEIHIWVRKVSSSFEDLYDKEMAQSQRSTRRLAFIKAMADKEIPAMSACGIIYFTRSYILSVFGGFFTYALLFINIKD
ncbi:uncharacterized protein TNIN_66771 [Trichonephila inaurata madagascariensis]|uniref:Gustatory receptor n=1 Tax=Trichonephila inaurata madagascariensis TaxID=2747483 RepID=A0A8X6WZH2_9ARAC|nr:uncharacterized protein TNIN_66771 [Trichonephila inaurata madagascariensis]